MKMPLIYLDISTPSITLSDVVLPFLVVGVIIAVIIAFCLIEQSINNKKTHNKNQPSDQNQQDSASTFETNDNVQEKGEK